MNKNWGIFITAACVVASLTGLSVYLANAPESTLTESRNLSAELSDEEAMGFAIRTLGSAGLNTDELSLVLNGGMPISRNIKNRNRMYILYKSKGSGHVYDYTVIIEADGKELNGRFYKTR